MRVARLQEEAARGREVRSGLVPEQRDELPDGVVEAGCRTIPFDHLGAFAAEEAFDHRPAERPNIVGGGARIARIAQLVGLGRERALADNFQEKLLVAAEGQKARRLAPRVETVRQLDRVAGENGGGHCQDRGPCANCSRLASRPRRLAARARFPRPARRDDSAVLVGRLETIRSPYPPAARKLMSVEASS